VTCAEPWAYVAALCSVVYACVQPATPPGPDPRTQCHWQRQVGTASQCTVEFRCDDGSTRNIRCEDNRCQCIEPAGYGAGFDPSPLCSQTAAQWEMTHRTRCPPQSPPIRPACASASADAGSLDVPAVAPLGGAVDLLVVVDNSNSMRENQANLVAQLGVLIGAMTSPPDVDGDGRPDWPALRDLRVGVVSTDLGTPGATVPGCANSDVGDDGLLNPIRYGQALARHEPWFGAPMGFRPDDCVRADQFPAFLSFASSTTNVATFTHDFHCTAALYVNGCGQEQPLEAIYRALVPRVTIGSSITTIPNAGFLRDDAVLAILVLTDEDDGSVRDCRYAATDASCARDACVDATDVFEAASTQWAAPNLNMRFYMYGPGSATDPTWSPDRYVDGRHPERGLLGLKPGHPERVVFGAITGVPLTIPQRMIGAQSVTAWDALLGAPDPSDRENFYGRDSMTAFDDPANREGPISMRQANQDANCPDRVVPACRREGSSYDPARPPCNPTEQYFAWPARRVVEIARRFDESPLCGGHACRNGMVSSICRRDFSSAARAFATLVLRQIALP